MNELIFFGHIAVLLFFTYLALRQGRETLLTLCALEWILANLFVTKSITLFSLQVTATDAYMIASLLGSNLLQEYFGKEEAKKVIPISLLLLVFFTAMAVLQISYRPSPEDHVHDAFVKILGTTPRVMLSSMIAFFITQRLDIELFGRLRKKLSLRKAMLSSLAITQGLDTLLFSCLALYGTVPSLLSIMVFSYGIKMLTLVSMTSFVRKRSVAHKI